jgi:hypothetical protein
MNDTIGASGQCATRCEWLHCGGCTHAEVHSEPLRTRSAHPPAALSASSLHRGGHPHRGARSVHTTGIHSHGHSRADPTVARAARRHTGRSAESTLPHRELAHTAREKPTDAVAVRACARECSLPAATSVEPPTPLPTLLRRSTFGRIYSSKQRGVKLERTSAAVNTIHIQTVQF